MPDAEYYEFREAQERVAPGCAINQAIARLHRESADKHAELAQAIRQSAKLRDLLDVE